MRKRDVRYWFLKFALLTWWTSGFCLSNLFSTPWKHRKTLWISDVLMGKRKDALGRNGLIVKYWYYAHLNIFKTTITSFRSHDFSLLWLHRLLGCGGKWTHHEIDSRQILLLVLLLLKVTDTTKQFFGLK